jgi:sensor histidine kinase YesM
LDEKIMKKHIIKQKPLTLSHLLKSLLYTAVFNTAIAMLLTTIGFGGSFWENLLFAQCVGLTMNLWISPAWHLGYGRTLPIRAALLCLSLCLGAVCGTALGAALVGLPGENVFTLVNQFLWKIVGISILFGLIITYFFDSREKLAASIQSAQEERIKRLSSEKLALETDLKRLQAQVEPHFLFNTLSNILSLMDTDPDKARSMQMDLIRYLRTTLRRTRDQQTTLGQESELIRAYLDIFKIRMGQRLDFKIDIPPMLREHPFPPLLLQPIIENALLHGLEPKIQGGQINIRAQDVDDRLSIEIKDTGNGLIEHDSRGVGLTNVRERLDQLFDEQARLIITENQPSGVSVVIEVPLLKDECKPHSDLEANS